MARDGGPGGLRMERKEDCRVPRDDKHLSSSEPRDVVAVGEFGRSPKINNMAGRDHWPQCYSALLAGGGIRGGRVVGASDAHGGHPHDHPVTPADLACTIHRAVGISSEQTALLGTVTGGEVIENLF